VRAKLSVGREGEIAVPPREAEALGLRGGGEVHFVTARGAFGLLVPARDAAPRAWFAGSLEALTVAEVVGLVYGSLKTGVLLLAFGDAVAGAPPDALDRLHRKSIYFRDGQVVFASSSDPLDRLGAVLSRAGMITAAELERCTRLVRSGRPLGQVLVDEGALDAGRLYEGLCRQVREIFLGAFEETSGEFAFLEGPFEEKNAVKLPERTRELLLAGLKRLDEAERGRAEAEASSFESAFAAATEAMPAARPTPTPRAAMEDAGVEIVVEPPAQKLGGPFEIYRRIFRRVHGALVAGDAGAAARLDTFFANLPEKKRAPFEGVSFGPEGELDVAQVLANVTATGTYRGAAARARALEALEELLAFALFEAKNRLSKDAAEALLREVGRMQVGKA
jgi:hypothetical protein